MHIARKEKNFNFLRWYSVISFFCILAISIITIFFLSRFLTNSTLQLDAVGTQYFIQTLIEGEEASPNFFNEDKPQRERQFSSLFQKVIKNPEIMWIRTYNLEGTIIWADDSRFIGHRFMPNDELIEALSGTMVVASGTSGRPRKGEHVFDKDVPYFSEIYIPIRDIDKKQVVGVVEVYKVPHALFQTIEKGTRWVMIGTGIGGFFLYISLYWIVNRASCTINRQQLDLQDANIKLQEKIIDAERTAEILGSLLITTGTAIHDQFFHDCVRDLAYIYEARYAFVGLFVNDSHESIRTIAFLEGSNFLENIEYRVAGSPCEDVLKGTTSYVSTNVIQKYPEDDFLREYELDSYFGAPLISPLKKPLGIVVLMDNKAMSLPYWAKPILGIMANRLALELERQSTEKALKLAESVFNESTEAIVVTNPKGRILRVNPAFTEMTGYSAAEAIHETPVLISPKHHDQTFFHRFREVLLNKGAWQGEVRGLRKNGETFPVWQSVSAVYDKSGDVIQFIHIMSDITDKKLSEEQIHYLAHFDELTGLPNRAYFKEQFKSTVTRARREKKPLALFYLDIDRFKLINDAYGHPTGDEVLKHVARCLKALVRENDLVARLGGDEFTILLSGLKNSQDVVGVAKKILEGLATPFLSSNKEIVSSSSIGISLFPENGSDVSALLKNADTAMNQAKESGRNKFQFFTAEMNHRVQKRMRMEAELRKGIERGELTLHYQPQLDILSGKIVACEALVRWNHPEMGVMLPDLFIPLAEESGLIEALGEWVLKAACKQWVRWQKEGLPALTMAVNFSGKQFTGGLMIPMIDKIVSSTGIDPKFLELELTESVLMENVEESIKNVDELRKRGILLSIDDFGTGYSSMAYLKLFPIHKLKIDQSFVRDLASDANDAAIVSATIALAHGLDLTVLAEGVETVRQLDFLKENGCDQFQGNYFSTPLSPDEMARRLAQSE